MEQQHASDRVAEILKYLIDGGLRSDQDVFDVFAVLSGTFDIDFIEQLMKLLKMPLVVAARLSRAIVNIRDSDEGAQIGVLSSKASPIQNTNL